MAFHNFINCTIFMNFGSNLFNDKENYTMIYNFLCKCLLLCILKVYKAEKTEKNLLIQK